MENQAADQTASPQVEGRKPCIACGELIPMHAVVCSHCLAHQVPEKPDRMKSVVTWVGYTSAILGLLATLLGGVRWWSDHRKMRGGIKSEIAVAETQTQQGEYEAAIHTYQDLLQKDPRNQRAADEELSTVMLWVENFHISAADGQDTTAVAVQKLDQIFALLDAARTRVHGTEAADVLAHIGWAHFMNSYEKFGKRESTKAARENLKAALMADPKNVYASAMLGNLLLQTGGNFHEALRHFAAALKTGKNRAFVRAMQMGGLDSYHGLSDARPEIVKAANDMRKNGEPLDEELKHRIAGEVYDSVVGSRDQLIAVLSAVPPDEALATYDWFEDREGGPDRQKVNREFLSANLTEMAGKHDEALQQFRALQDELKQRSDVGFNYTRPVDEAVLRLSGDAAPKSAAKHKAAH